MRPTKNCRPSVFLKKQGGYVDAVSHHCFFLVSAATCINSLGEDIDDDFGGLDAGETDVKSLILDAQAAVVDAHEVQDRGVHVVDGDRIADDVVANGK
jgi:hypothetical protein